ncbi:hypothetical protein [Saccharothrix longispora]|uniref:hypothetical protein n=1 Tax=Saccharothrix longispora TaxID=33920 RepID=UPI0028FD48A5|nr:hypothetical protein [Saccharothrix longispora]MDU0294475.1 hypothetical protein [Saccharothrix longispora]
MLGIKIAASTIRQILKDAGINPAPERTSTTWSAFLRFQADALLACDFFETHTLSPFQPGGVDGDRGRDMAKLLVDDFSTKSKAIARSFACLSTHPRSTCPAHTSGSWRGN